MPPRRFVMSASRYTWRTNHGHPTACRHCGTECTPGTNVVTRMRASTTSRNHLYCEPCAGKLSIIAPQRRRRSGSGEEEAAPQK